MPGLKFSKHVQAQREAAENARRQAEEERGATSSARQRAAQLEEEMSQKLQEAGRERETLLQQLQALQQSAHPVYYRSTTPLRLPARAFKDQGKVAMDSQVTDTPKAHVEEVRIICSMPQSICKTTAAGPCG